MRRTYEYLLSTPFAAAAFGDDYAENIHEHNVEAHHWHKSCLEEFQVAMRSKKQIEQRWRDKRRREANQAEYGTARWPSE
jgi:hypothetical protein